MTTTPHPPIQIAAHERQPLREAMRDVQKSVSAYYSATATGDELGSHVRAFLVSAQTLNDLFTNAVTDSTAYLATLDTTAQTDADLVWGIKYARNVAQHVLHIVRPSDDMTLVGGTLGLRAYALWDEIPAAAHMKLRPGTQKLKPAYDAALRGQEVTSTMLALLRFYGRTAPSIVHRDQRGEWTGFPLMSQPGMSSPLHPEEPLDIADAWPWLNRRPPGGDARVICGQHALNGTSYVFGHTFVGRHSFAPFVESVEQVNIDIGLGYSYLTGSTTDNLEDVSSQFPHARQGGVLASRDDLDAWALPITHIEHVDDWCVDAHSDEWARIVRLERGGLIPDFVEYGLRRARRLNALVPPSA